MLVQLSLVLNGKDVENGCGKPDLVKHYRLRFPLQSKLKERLFSETGTMFNQETISELRQEEKRLRHSYY